MSNADRLQAAHRLPQALEERLHAIHIGAATWHDYHQAGVLVAELMRSIYLRYGSVFHFDCLELIEHAEWLFNAAFIGLPDNSTLEEYGILCDRELMRAFKLFILHDFTSPTQYEELESAIAHMLVLKPESPRRARQLAIAHSFLARAQWWRYSVDKDQAIRDQAEQNQAYADRLFADNLADTTDRGKAYCSHMLNMALTHQQLKLPWWRKWRRMFVWPALQLALRQRDFTQAFRAAVIGLFGMWGENQLRKRRDTLGVFAETADRLKVIRRH